MAAIGRNLSIGIAYSQTASSLATLPENLAATIDPRIADRIASLKAIDNYAHPVLPPLDDEKDRGFDALPVDNMEPETDLLAWRPDNPQFPAAQRRVKAREGQHYDDWVLN